MYLKCQFVKCLQYFSPFCIQITYFLDKDELKFTFPTEVLYMCVGCVCGGGFMPGDLMGEIRPLTITGNVDYFILEFRKLSVPSQIIITEGFHII